MRKNIVAGNWKMNTTLPEGLQLAKEVNDALKGIDAKCDVIICVPFTHLAPINGVIDQNILVLVQKTALTIPQVPTPARFRLPWLPQPVPLM